MIILLFFLVIFAVFIGMYNIYTKQKSQIKHLFHQIEPLLHKRVEWTQQQIANLNPRDIDTQKRLDELIWRLKSRDTSLNQRIMLYNRIHNLATNKLSHQIEIANTTEPDEEIKNLNEQLQHASNAYNDTAKEYNGMLSKFPTQIIAALFNHHKFKLLEQ